MTSLPVWMFILAMFLIVTGGDRPGRELLEDLASRAELIIAADRGAQYCLEHGITPGLVVGDMDSIDHASLLRLEAMRVEMKKCSPDKDRTDTEIALDEAVLRGARHIEIIGATGDRLDHTLANVHLLRKALKRGITARITSQTQQIFLVDSHETITGSRGCTISFLPLSGRVRGISLDGFRYPLKDAAMEMGKPYGISNVVESDRAHIALSSGILLAVLTRS